MAGSENGPYVASDRCANASYRSYVVSNRANRLVAILVGLSFGLLGLAWAGGSPAGAAPDEPAHFVKAYATADGQLAGERVASDLSGLRSRRAAWFEVSGRSYWLPARIVPPPSVLCYAFNPERTADCQDFGAPNRDPEAKSLVFTHLATYSPFPYVVAGYAMRGASDYRAAAWRGRLASLAVCTLFVGWSAWLVRRRGPVALGSLALALTPAVVFLAASLNTSGIEITSAICFWSALLLCVRESGTGKSAWAAIAVSGAALALTRPLGAVLLPAVVATVLVFAGFAQLWSAFRATPKVACASLGVVFVACSVSFLWARFAIPHPHVDWGLALRSVHGALRDLPNQARGVIGIFGYNNMTMPNAVYAFAALVLGGLGVLALRMGRLREQLALVGLGLAAAALNVALAVLIEAQIGFGMQARYLMPLIVGLPLLAGEILLTRADEFQPRTLRTLLGIAYGGSAFVHIAAFLTNQHRYAVGLSGDWLPLWESRWSPDGGLAMWLVFAFGGSLCLISACLIAQRAPFARHRL